MIPDHTQIRHLHKVAEVFTFRNEPAVRAFLQTCPYLIEDILEAYPHLVKHFGPSPQVMLEVVKDPESEEDSEQLFAYILNSLPADEALERLDKLDEEWFLGQFDRVGKLFNFNL